MRWPATFVLLCLAAFRGIGIADTPECVCDHQVKASLESRTCGLCLQAENAPGSDPVFFLKDNSPTKPHRWLALPRGHQGRNMQLPGDLTAQERVVLWRAAIARAKQQFGDQWGLALNGVKSRTQCHLHIHIGRLVEGVEWGDATEIIGPEEIPDPGEKGLWIHPVNGKLHVHVEMSSETVLAR